MAGRLQDKIAVVTGGAKGIGRATVERFAADGAKVVAADADEKALSVLSADFDGVISHVLDLTHAADQRALFDKVIAEFGRLDILVNNAGIGGPRTQRLHEVSMDDFDRVMDVNVRAPLALIKLAVPIMTRQGGGAIVNLASPSGFIATPNVSSYSISKAAMVMLTKCAAKEYAADNIRVNAVAPGVTETSILEGLPEEHLNMIIAMIPQNRIAQPSEIAAMITHLASDDATYVNGSVVFVDGAAHT